MTYKGARSGPFVCQRRHALLSHFYSATLAWNYSAVDSCPSFVSEPPGDRLAHSPKARAAIHTYVCNLVF